MTREEAKKWKREIEAFGKGEQILMLVEGTWAAVSRISWEYSASYVIYDDHVEMRKAFEEAEELEYIHVSGGVVLNVNPDKRDAFNGLLESVNWIVRKKKKKWYALEDNIGKIITVSDNKDFRDSRIERFEGYLEGKEYKFEADSMRWKYARLVDPSELAQEENC